MHFKVSGTVYCFNKIVNLDKDANKTHLFYKNNSNEKLAQVICKVCKIKFTPQNIERHMKRAHSIETDKSESESESERSILQILELNDSIDDEYLQKPKLQKIHDYRKRIKHFKCSVMDKVSNWSVCKDTVDYNWR